MNKEELLFELSQKLASGEISKAELVNLFGEMRSDTPAQMIESGTTSKFSMTKLLYIIGSIIVTIGIIFFVAQIWEDIGSFGRIFITLVLGIVFAALGSEFMRRGIGDKLGQIFHCIGGILIPGGAVVLLNEFDTHTGSLWPFAFTFAIIFASYLMLAFVHRDAILTFFAIANGTTFIYFLIGAMIDDVVTYSMKGDIYAYLTMVIGASYLFLSRHFQNTWNEKLCGALNLFGSFAFFGATFSRVFDSTLWQFLYFIVVFGGVYASIQLKSKSILVASTIFMIAHFTYITSEYFADSLGWPVALVFLGFIFIGLGYGSVMINRNYISSEKPTFS